MLNKIILAYHQGFGNELGTDNGVQIIQSVNVYVVDFFNTFLNRSSNPFKRCISYMDRMLAGCVLKVGVNAQYYNNFLFCSFYQKVKIPYCQGIGTSYNQED